MISCEQQSYANDFNFKVQSSDLYFLKMIAHQLISYIICYRNNENYLFIYINIFKTRHFRNKVLFNSIN